MRKIITFIVSIFLFAFLLAPKQVEAIGENNYIEKDYTKCMEGAITLGKLCIGGTVSTVQYTMMAYLIQLIMPLPRLAYDPDASPEYIAYLEGQSAVPQVTKYIASLMTSPPASTYAFFHDAGQSLGIIPKQANAQGIGFAGMTPFLPIWKVARNIAYVLVAFVMISLGFMIMFRKKIDPKTVVTIQNSLPKIGLSLVLITFSYAIVGFLIDAMYLTIFFLFSMINAAKPLPPVSWVQTNVAKITTTQQALTSGDLFSIVGGQIIDIGSLMKFGFDLTGFSWDPRSGLPPQQIFTIAAGAVLGLLKNDLQGLAIGAAAGAVGPPILVFLLLAFALLFSIIRLFLLLLTSYINIIVSLIIAPLQLMMEAVPGSHAFESWIKNLIANLAVFPVTAVMFMVAMIIKQSSGTGLWTPPFMNFFGSLSVDAIAAMISLGVLFAIPQICAQVQKMLKAEPALPIGPSTLLGPVAHAAGQVGGLFSQVYYMKAMLGAFQGPGKEGGAAQKH